MPLKSYNKLMNQTLENMRRPNEEHLCRVYGIYWREVAFGILPTKMSEMFAAITSGGELVLFYYDRFMRPVERILPLSAATKLKIKGPSALGTFKISMKLKVNGKKERVDMQIASAVIDADLDDQPKNVDRFIRELRRGTKIFY